MVESLIAYSSLAASQKLLSNAVDDLYTYLKNKASVKIKQADIQRKLPMLRDYIENVRLVKTLWQIDKAVDVESFYCESHVVIRKKRSEGTYRRRINFVSDLNSKDNFVIQGIAGQGKSILLRHLFINETRIGSHIPIFIELRRIQKDETLLDNISRSLNILDLPSDNKLIEILLKSGKFIFFLDGFDEISSDRMPSILNELEYLTFLSRDCQFIVTSRPNSPIAMSPVFNVVLLDNLRGKEYEKVIRKLSDTKKYADVIIAKIKSQKPGMSGLLCTPLLVTLLLISYKSYQVIPIQLSDFYESIFINLLQRHDGTKPTFTRPRKCSLNDNQYRHVFDAFCFESKKSKNEFFDYQKVYSLVEKATSLLSINEDIDAYIKDITSITCLLLEESNRYRFIHRTVQEYYSASFIKSRPEPIATRFYQACLDPSKSLHWDQELSFLSDIDRYRHSKYYLLPLCSTRMGYDDDVDSTFLHPSDISLDRTKNILGFLQLEIKQNGKPEPISMYSTVSFHFYGVPIWDIFSELRAFDYTGLLANIVSGKVVTNTKEIPFSLRRGGAKEKSTWISVGQILDEGFLTSEFKSVAQRISSHAYNIWLQTTSYLNQQDALIKTVEVI